MKNIKVVIVGDGAVGKTCVLSVYQNRAFPEEYIPTVFENYTVKFNLDKEEISLHLWDTAGQEELENIRVLSYSQTNLFLLCFAVSEPDSLENVKAKWLPELNQYVVSPRIVLVGTKTDLRDDPQTIQTLKDRGLAPITNAQGSQKAKEIGALAYFEVSAKADPASVVKLFDQAVPLAIPKKERKCLIV